MRITSKRAHEKFANMVEFGTSVGADMTGWRFGQFYGQLYVLERPHSTYPDTHTAVESFWSPREAWDYMNGMISGFYAVQLTNTNREIPELKLIA